MRSVPLSRRFFIAGALSLTGAGALASCARQQAQPGAGRPQEAVKGPVTIVIHTRPGPTGHTGWYIERKPAFEQEHPGITLQFDEISGVSIAEKLLVLHAAGSTGDVAWFGVVSDGGRGPMFKGVFRPLDDLIKADKFDTSVFWKPILDVMANEGKQYGIPTHGHFGTTVAFVNMDLAEKAGVKIPVEDGNWTTDDLIAIAQKATRPENDEWGWWPATAMNEHGIQFLRTFGGDFFAPDGRRVVIDQPAAIEALQWLNDAQYKFKTIDSFFRPGGIIGSSGLFERGKLLCTTWTPGLVAEFSKPGRVNFKWAAVLVPKHPTTGRRGTQVSGAGMGVTSLTKNPDAAWKWVKWITNKENGVLQVQGGAGSPGARSDVWSDARLHAFNPIYGLTLRAFNNTPGPLYLPANHRYFEVMQETNQRLNKLWRNEGSARDVAREIADEVNRILALPPE